jgi:hypothetical protein
MPNIDYSELVKKMLDAAKGVLSEHWNEARPYAEKEFSSLAANVKLIASLKAEDKITEEQARLYMDIQKSSIRVVLLTIQGLGILAVESAINAALDIIRSTVNTAIGWNIL